MQLTYKDICRFENFYWRGTKEQCWVWNGCKTPKQRGHFDLNGRQVYASRVAYQIEFGSFDESLLVLHTCDNPSCVNPNHLFLGTHEDNMCDMLAKGRAPNNSFHGENHANHKLFDNDIEEIRQLYWNGNFNQKELAQQYGLSRSQLCRIVHYKRRVR